MTPPADYAYTLSTVLARVKGAGVDCLMLLAEVYERAGITAHVEPPFYVPDWHLHRDAERYLDGLRAWQATGAGRGEPTAARAVTE